MTEPPSTKGCRPRSRASLLALALLPAFSLQGFSATDDPWILEPRRYELDGRTDDLLTAGLGIDGLTHPPPTLDDPLQPSWSAVRRRAIAQSWRALADLRPAGGFGVSHGPLADTRIAGTEYLALLRDPEVDTGRFTLWLQIPQSFDPARPCLVVAAASGSRGVFGALPTAGERALQRGCAVAHNDKGLGNGVLDPATDMTLSYDGRLVQANDPTALFSIADGASPTVDMTTAPHALLMKHAHAGDNPEARWGKLLLRSGEAALALLNRERPGGSKPFTPHNTLIIAAGISNGGAAALQALEADRGKFFDAALVGEPNVQPAGAPAMYEYATLLGLLQPCAILAEDLASIPLGAAIGFAAERHRDWCRRLAASGAVNGDSVDAIASAARQRLLESGILPEALRLGAINLQFGLWPSIGATYASAYSGNRDAQLPCKLAFSAIDADGRPRRLNPTELVAAFTDSSGIAPSASVALIGTDGAGTQSVAAALGWQTAQCLHELAPRLTKAIEATRVNGRPGQRPVVILHGRADALIAVQHSARAYVERTLSIAPRSSEVHYFEIDRAQHFDAFLALPGMGTSQALQPHLNAAFDLLLARLREGRTIPPSQRVDRSINEVPEKPITFARGRLIIPE